MNEVAIKYHNIYHETSLGNTIEAFNRIPENIISSGNKNMSVIFVRLLDQTYNFIKRNPLYLIEPEFLISCYRQDGNNIHLIKAFGNGYKEFREIILSLKEKYNPRTLTWFRDDFIKLHSVKCGGY